MAVQDHVVVTETNGDVQKKTKLHGRAFYESLGSPKMILAPMVDQSEFAWRLLTRSFMPPDQKSDLLAYSPMLHARLFAEKGQYRETSFQPTKPSSSNPETSEPHLDGNPAIDRPLIVQFCANDPDVLLEAARHVEPFCDAVDLNLGCPQGIARKGHYGAFLQEDQPLIFKLINNLHRNLNIPVTAKMRILETKEQTLEYAQMILRAGASFLTVHGRERHQKGHNTGLADWEMIRYLRDNLPPETVLFANGNVLQHDDLKRCLDATGADGVMSAEGNLHDPAIFAGPPPDAETIIEYWRGRDGKGGWRLDAVMRRYFDIIYKYVLEIDPPKRAPIFVPSGSLEDVETQEISESKEEQVEEPPNKKRKRDEGGKVHKRNSPNLGPLQSHLFNLLRPLVSVHTDVRDQLARSRGGNMEAFEKVLSMVENAVRKGLIEYELETRKLNDQTNGSEIKHEVEEWVLDPESSKKAIERCKRPWWIAQPYIRPLPKEAFEKGSLQLSKKEKARVAMENGSLNGDAKQDSQDQHIQTPLVEKIVDAAIAG